MNPPTPPANLYAFELGRNKDLCFAELIAVLGQKNLVERNLDTAIFKVDEKSSGTLGNWQKLQDRLGGTIKIIKISESLGSQSPSHLNPTVEKLLSDSLKGHSGKINFSLSILSFKNPREINSKQLLNFSKIFLKSLGLNSRFVNKDYKNAKPSTIYKARVLEKGIDINIIKGNFGKFFIGKTVAIQNIDNYSKRDYGKPYRDASIGMLPPKLAQIMINLAIAGTTDKISSDSTNYPATIFDPFCGTGTILMEGMLMGLKTIGSDIDPKMVDFSQKNCQWLVNEFRLPQLSSQSAYRIFERDARFLNSKVLPEKINAIATEGYLGKLFTKTPSQEEREITFRELANLHLNWLSAIHPLLPKNGKIVMCVAGYKIGEKIEHLERFNELTKKAGYKVVSIFTYSRPDQIVVRDIKILEKFA